MDCILVVGGCGFIGSHTCLTLLKQGYDIVILDNLTNSSRLVIDRISKILCFTETELNSRLTLIEGDIRDHRFIDNLFIDQINRNKPISSVFHFAGLKSVKESVINPKKYWNVNVIGSNNLINVMVKHNCKTLIFSSSATIYGESTNYLIPEDSKIKPINPYGETKAEIEKILYDLAGCNKKSSNIKIPSPKGWRIARLRYFNPVGAHESGLIGESPVGAPNNLFPIISQVVIKKEDSLKIFGNDWPTPDGSAIRDYIHVMDVAEGHYYALKYLLNSEPQLLTLNLGTGKGTSVFKVIKTFEKVIKKNIRYEIVERRSGDPAMVVADVRMAKKYLNWEAKRDLDEMCSTCIKWQSSNPNGFLKHY